MPQQFVVSGNVFFSENRGPVLEGRVEVHDRDLPSLEQRGAVPQLLGQSPLDVNGRFRIEFTDDQFRRAEGEVTALRRTGKVNPDLSFRVYDATGQELTIARLEALNREYRPNQIIFNAPSELEVTISIESRQETDASEYESLVAAIIPVIGTLPLAELTEEDIGFLASELEFDDEQTARLRWLRAAAVLAERTGTIAEAFYGWARTALPALWGELRLLGDEDRRNAVMSRLLDELAATAEETLIAHLLRAIEERIIPARIRDRATAIARTIRRRTQQEYSVTLRLERTPTGEPLIGYTVRTFDVDENNRDLGTDVTDALGEFVVAYFASSNAQGAERGLRFRVRGPAFDQDIEVTQRIRPDAHTVIGIRVSVPTSQPTLQELRGAGRIDVPESILETLERQHGIHSFADIRRRGGLSRVADVRSLDSVAIRRLDALADLDRLSSNVSETLVLLAHQYDSVAAIAAVSRREFVTAMSTQEANFSERRATELHIEAQAQTEMLEQIFAGIMIDFANGIRPSSGFVDGDYLPPFPSEEQQHG